MGIRRGETGLPTSLNHCDGRWIDSGEGWDTTVELMREIREEEGYDDGGREKRREGREYITSIRRGNEG
jgi:hypothetical protein